MFKRTQPEPSRALVNEPLSPRESGQGSGAVGEGGFCALVIDGRKVEAREGDTVAAAMLAAGFDHCRTTPVSGAPRAPYCMMGVCFDCLVTIDGVGNRQGCLVRVSEGMEVEMQRGKRELGR